MEAQDATGTSQALTAVERKRHSGASCGARVWVFMADGRNTRDLRDLEHLDAILWGANPHARGGDLVLMYRTHSYRDIAYIFRAVSDPRPTRREDQADTSHVIQLDHKVSLTRPIKLEELKSQKRLKRWSFLKFARGEMRRREDLVRLGVWPALSALIMRRNPGLNLDTLSGSDGVDPRSAFRWRGLRVFFSYAHKDKERTKAIYRPLSRLRGVDVWRDDKRLGAGAVWNSVIERAIRASDIVIICLSCRALKPRGYVRREIDLALRAADERSTGLWIVPVKLEACNPGRRLRRWQWVSISDRQGIERLIATVRNRARRPGVLR